MRNKNLVNDFSYHHLLFALFLLLLSAVLPSYFAVGQTKPVSSAGNQVPEYLWYEAENMRGFSTQPNGEPVLNPSWLDSGKAKSPGWGINGPGVSAEWSQGGESEWNSAAASADEDKGEIYQDLEIPRAGFYKIWVRYGDWAGKNENFSLRVIQNGRVVLQHEFGAADVVDPHDEVSMYWGWAFAWDGSAAKLDKGPARVSIGLEKPSGARRVVDAVILTTDLTYVPEGRRKPEFAAARYLRQWAGSRTSLRSLLTNDTLNSSGNWQRSKVTGREFLMPWNITDDFWKLYDKPLAERPLYPFNAEPIEAFVEEYKGARDVPIFSSKLIVPVIYINRLGEYLREGSPFLRYLRETRVPFAILINYGSPVMSPEEGRAAWALLNGELKDQFLGWISGESIGHVWGDAPNNLKISPVMSRAELLEAHRVFYNDALSRKWSAIFHTQTGPMWEKLIPAQSTSSTTYAHALSDWGVKLLGVETAAVQPMFAMRIAFTRGAARQFGGNFLYYHAPNFGDTATTFTKQMDFAGPDHFFHTRYGTTMGPSLSWYRKSYYLYYLSGASAIYLEQGFDQFFKPGPGEHQFQLNPLGRITEEFIKFAERHPDRGVAYTPIAFLLDPAHGWDMTDYPQWPFGVSQINRTDRALRELFGVAYFPGLINEGEPATADRQAFVNGVFGDIFDVLVASGRPGATSSANPLEKYRAIVAGGHIDWSPQWVERLTKYVKEGGTVVLNSAQARGLPEQLLGVHLSGKSAEADNARCISDGEGETDLRGQMFRYEKIDPGSAKTLIQTDSGDPLVTVNQVSKGMIVFCTLPDLLGEDERITPFAAHMLAHVFSNAAPVRVIGDAEFLLNRNDGGWVVTVFNNNGVFKPQQGMAQVDRSAYVTVTISVPSQRIETAVDWTTDKPVAVERSNGEDKLTLSVAPGGISVINLRTVRAQ